MSTPAAKPLSAANASVAVAACVGVVLFQFFGSAAHGYVKSPSLFWWWFSQWLDPQSETGHGLLILPLAAWLFWRGLRLECGDPAALSHADAANIPKRRQVAALQTGQTWPGAAALVAAL